MADSIVDDLENLGHDVWFDQELSGGQVWWDQILAAIREYHVFVFVLEPDALNSTACRRELSYAAQLGKPVLPVLIAEGFSTNLLPPELSVIHWVNYKQRDGNSIISLVKALNNIPPSKPLPDPLPPSPEVPVSYLGGLAKRIDTPSTLSYEEQSTLVFDLKAALKDSVMRDDALELVERLRRRRDLLATIATEIDDLLVPPGSAWPKDKKPFNDQRKGQDKQIEIASPDSPGTIEIKTRSHRNLRNASVGIIVVVILFVLLSTISGGTFTEGLAFVTTPLGVLGVTFGAAVGAAVGAIVGKVKGWA